MTLNTNNTCNVHQAIAEGLAAELKPPPGYTIEAYHNPAPTNDPIWQVLITKPNNKQPTAIITLWHDTIVWTGPSQRKKLPDGHQHTNSHYDYNNPQLIHQLQHMLTDLPNHQNNNTTLIP